MLSTAGRFLGRHSLTNWALADQALVSGVNFLTGILLAHGLGIAAFGQFSLSWLVVLFVQSIQDNAVIAPMMSIGPKQNPEERASYYGGVFFQQAVFAGVSTLATWVILRLAPSVTGITEIAQLTPPLVAAVLFSQTQEFLRRYAFAVENPKGGFISDALRYAGHLAVLYWLFFAAEAGGVGAALWTMAGTSAGGAVVVLASVGKLNWTSSTLRQTTLRHWPSSRWLIGAGLAQWMSSNVFIVAAGAGLGVIAVGALKAAQSLVGVAHILFQGMENFVPIRAAQRYQTYGSAGLSRYLAAVTRLGLTATILTGIAFSLDAQFWFRLAFGDEFTPYGYLLRWYAIVYVIMAMAVPLRFGLRAKERTAAIFYAHALAAGFSLIAAYPLVTKFGLNGVVAGLCTIQLILFSAMLASYRRGPVRHAANSRLHP